MDELRNLDVKKIEVDWLGRLIFTFDNDEKAELVLEEGEQGIPTGLKLQRKYE